MKKYILALLIAITSFTIANAQSYLCTYEGGYFIRNGSNWYEYRPQDKNDVWAHYTQYSKDDNYYYIYNDKCSICIPLSAKNNIWIKKGDSKWETIYTTINVYDYCPERSSQLFTYQNGFFIKQGNTWNFYIPKKKPNSIWATYSQYDNDENYYYIKNSSDDLAIPRKSKNSFYWRKNGEWEKLYSTLAIYDAQSPEAKSRNAYTANSNVNSQSSNQKKNVNNNSSNSSKAQSSQKETYHTYQRGVFSDLNAPSIFSVDNPEASINDITIKFTSNGLYRYFRGTPDEGGWEIVDKTWYYELVESTSKSKVYKHEVPANSYGVSSVSYIIHDLTNDEIVLQIIISGVCSTDWASKKIKRGVNINGGHSNHNSYQSSSGSSSSSNSKKCPGCGGNGRCTACQYSDKPGKQKIYAMSGPNYYIDCPVCHGSAECKVCFGRGTIR